MAPTKRCVMITVDDTYRDKLDKLVERLTKYGVQVEHVMESIGLMSGRTEVSNAAIKTVTGVASVEDTATFFSVKKAETPREPAVLGSKETPTVKRLRTEADAS